jgi:hypothetical protein
MMALGTAGPFSRTWPSIVPVADCAAACVCTPLPITAVVKAAATTTTIRRLQMTISVETFRDVVRRRAS